MMAPLAFLASATCTSDLQNKILRSGSVASPEPSFQASFNVWTAIYERYIVFRSLRRAQVQAFKEPLGPPEVR